MVAWAAYGLTDDERAAMRAEGNVRYWGGPSDGGSYRFVSPTNSRRAIIDAVVRICDENLSRQRMVHRLSVTLDGVVDNAASGIQLELFADEQALAREHRRQLAVSAVREKFGKNSLLKGIDLLPEATARERNRQIGGHRSGKEE